MTDYTDRQLTDLYKNLLGNIAQASSSGGQAQQTIWFSLANQKVQGTCVQNVPQGECLALKDNNGKWWLLPSTQEVLNTVVDKKIVEYRRTAVNKRTVNYNCLMLFCTQAIDFKLFARLSHNLPSTAASLYISNKPIQVTISYTMSEKYANDIPQLKLLYGNDEEIANIELLETNIEEQFTFNFDYNLTRSSHIVLSFITEHPTSVLDCSISLFLDFYISNGNQIKNIGLNIENDTGADYVSYGYAQRNQAYILPGKLNSQIIIKHGRASNLFSKIESLIINNRTLEVTKKNTYNYPDIISTNTNDWRYPLLISYEIPVLADSCLIKYGTFKLEDGNAISYNTKKKQIISFDPFQVFQGINGDFSQLVFSRNLKGIIYIGRFNRNTNDCQIVFSDQAYFRFNKINGQENFASENRMLAIAFYQT